MLTVLVCLALLLGYALLQVPIMLRLDADVKRSRGTLLYLPPAAIEVVPALRQLLMEAGLLTSAQMSTIMKHR